MTDFSKLRETIERGGATRYHEAAAARGKLFARERIALPPRGIGGHDVEVPVEDHAKLRSRRATVAVGVDKGARLAVGLEPLPRKPWTNEVDDQLHSTPKLLRPVRRRLHDRAGAATGRSPRVISADLSQGSGHPEAAR